MCVLVTIMCLGLLVLEGLPGSAACIQQCVLNCERAMDDPELTANTLCCDCRSICDKLCRLHDNSKSNSSKLSGGSSPVDLSTSPESDRMSVSGLQANMLKGLLASCRPCRPRTRRKPRSPSLREAALIARSVGMDLGVPENELAFDEGGFTNKEMMADWQPQMTSLSWEGEAVSARLGWERPPGAGPWYLVTWAPEEGGLNGNLLTNTSTVSLSLEADKLYHLQVSVLSTGQISQCLQVDTHSLAVPRLMAPFSGVEVVAGVGAAVLMFLLGVLLLATRKPSLAKEFNQFKLYPPPVTIVHNIPTPASSSPPPTLSLAV